MKKQEQKKKKTTKKERSKTKLTSKKQKKTSKIVDKPAKQKRKESLKTPQKTTKKLKPEDIRKAELKKLLLKKREEVVREAKIEISKYIKGETKQLVDTALDDGDWSIVDLSEDISLKQLNTHRENLQKIDEALRKLEEGTYGICEDCGEEISEERLKIMPFAIYCIDCQEKREQLEEMEKKEGLL
jgi:DnaK suppressor protein